MGARIKVIIGDGFPANIRWGETAAPSFVSRGVRPSHHRQHASGDDLPVG